MALVGVVGCGFLVFLVPLFFLGMKRLSVYTYLLHKSNRVVVEYPWIFCVLFSSRCVRAARPLPVFLRGLVLCLYMPPFSSSSAGGKLLSIPGDRGHRLLDSGKPLWYLIT